VSHRGQPLYYTNHLEGLVMIAPPPPASMNGTIRCVARPDGLSASNDSTWLSTHAGDIMQYACLMAAEEYLKSPQKAKEWEDKYNAAMPTFKAEHADLIRTSGYSPVKAAAEVLGVAGDVK